MIGYLDLVGGVSGDMLLGSIVNSGLPLETLRKELALLPLPASQWDVTTEKVQRGAVEADKVTVHLRDTSDKLGWDDFHKLSGESGLPELDKAAIARIFGILARAEAEAHNIAETDPPKSLTLHELGTLDTLIDIAGVVAGLRLLEVTDLHASPVPVGIGWSDTAHGAMPATSLASFAICKSYKIPMRVSPDGPSGESATPTGLAILAGLARFTTATFTIHTRGHGAGYRSLQTGPPNIVSLWLGESGSHSGEQLMSGIILLETNLDDVTGEEAGYVLERLMATSALDAWISPIYMKKNRPGIVISALVREEDEDAAVRILFKETTTLGVRKRRIERYEVERVTHIIDTDLGAIPVKFKSTGGNTMHAAPEYETCRAIAAKTGLPLMEVLRIAEAAAHAKQGL